MDFARMYDTNRPRKAPSTFVLLSFDFSFTDLPLQIYLGLHDDPASFVKSALTNGAALVAKEDKKAENKAKKLDKGKKGELCVLAHTDLADVAVQSPRRQMMMSMFLRRWSIWIRSEKNFWRLKILLGRR